jgi:hypothetical protein
MYFMLVASISYAVAFQASFLGYLKLILWSVFIDFIGVGIIVATITW